MTKTYPCPCCGKPMKHCSANSGSFKAYEMWCGHGPCQSYATNNGAVRQTLEECAAAIENAYEIELECKKWLGWSNAECGE